MLFIQLLNKIGIILFLVSVFTFNSFFFFNFSVNLEEQTIPFLILHNSWSQY